VTRTSQVTRLRTRTQPFEEIVENYFGGLFFACRNALQSYTTPAGAALYARASIRADRPADALQAVAAVIGGVTDLTHAERGELMMLRAIALARLAPAGDDRTRDALSTARAHVYSSMSPALEAELGCAESHMHAVRGELEPAANVARGVLEIPRDDGSHPHLIPLEHSRARAYDLLGFVAARREDDAGQRRHLLAALGECDRASVHDLVFEANLLVNLAIFAREFGDDGSVRARLGALGEVEQLSAQRYEILRCLAWSNALVGDHLGTFRDLRDASEAAPTTATKIRAVVDRAFFADELGQQLIAREELDFALRLSERVEWNAVASSERELAALLHLGVALIPVDLPRARAMIERYRRLKAKFAPSLLAANDRRARAEEMSAEAKIAVADGNLARARALLLDAFEIWDARGYVIRAAMVARDLSALGAGECFTAYVADAAERRPQSWLATARA